MVESVDIHLVEHPLGWHVYVWRSQQHGKHRKRRQVGVVWIPDPGCRLKPPDLLERVAGVLRMPEVFRPSPGAQAPSGAPGGGGGEPK